MTTPTIHKTDDEGHERFGAAEVIDFVLAHYEVVRSTDGLSLAVPSDPSAPKIAREVSSLAADLRSALWKSDRRTVGRDTLKTALDTLAGFAEERDPKRIHLRAADLDASVYLDLGDRSGRVVEASRYGWEIRDPAEEADPDAFRPIFRRTAATRPLPAPERGGDRDDLRRLLGLAEDDPRWKLLWGWLVASLFERTPRPILWALGPQGSGKSTRARMALSVIDPSDALGREPGRNERDDSTAALGRFLPSWDNIGTVSASTSDWFCRLVTGVEIGRRVLFSDEDLRVSTLRRSGVATSIVLPFGLGPDALERLVLVEFERVAEDERRAESDLWAEFAEAHPRILGALLDDVVGVLANVAEAREAGHRLPRMADYATLLHALDLHLDLDPWEGFAEAYTRGVRAVMADRATADPLTAALLKHAERHGGDWRGDVTTLLRSIEKDRPDDFRAPWPSSPRSLGHAIRKGQETLRAAGLVVEDGRSGSGRWIRLTARPVDPDLVDDDAEE